MRLIASGLRVSWRHPDTFRRYYIPHRIGPIARAQIWHVENNKQSISLLPQQLEKHSENSAYPCRITEDEQTYTLEILKQLL